MLFRSLYKEVEALQNGLVSERELQKVKNLQQATDFRRLQSNFGLMMQLLSSEAQGSWQTINSYVEKFQKVTPEDIQRVAKSYFAPENRTVGVYYTKRGAAQAPAAGGAQ